MNKSKVRKEDVFYSLWVFDRAVSKEYCKYLNNLGSNNTCKMALNLLIKTRDRLMAEYQYLVGNVEEFNKEYSKYVNKKAKTG